MFLGIFVSCRSTGDQERGKKGEKEQQVTKIRAQCTVVKLKNISGSARLIPRFEGKQCIQEVKKGAREASPSVTGRCCKLAALFAQGEIAERERTVAPEVEGKNHQEETATSECRLQLAAAAVEAT